MNRAEFQHRIFCFGHWEMSIILRTVENLTNIEPLSNLSPYTGRGLRMSVFIYKKVQFLTIFSILTPNSKFLTPTLHPFNNLLT
jgi:hypothetical protein